MESAKIFKNTFKALKLFGAELQRRARFELTVRRRRKRVRSTWEKGKPKEFTIRSTYRAGDKNSRLAKSIKNKVTPTQRGFTVRLLAKDYWKNVEYGMKPFKERATQTPNDVSAKAIAEWTQRKNIQPRDLTTNQFVPRTPENIASMNYNIRRSISFFGIEPLPFTKTALNATLSKDLRKVEKAVTKDIAENIKPKK